MLEVVVRVKVQILVSVRRFAVDCDLRTAIILNVDAGIEEWEFAIQLWLCGEFDVGCLCGLWALMICCHVTVTKTVT